jgi:hypothetical protein
MTALGFVMAAVATAGQVVHVDGPESHRTAKAACEPRSAVPDHGKQPPRGFYESIADWMMTHD